MVFYNYGQNPIVGFHKRWLLDHWRRTIQL